MKKIHDPVRQSVVCQSIDCNRRFFLLSPEDIVLAMSVDENDNEVGQAYIFACPSCRRKFSPLEDEDV